MRSGQNALEQGRAEMDNSFALVVLNRLSYSATLLTIVEPNPIHAGAKHANSIFWSTRRNLGFTKQNFYIGK